MRLRRVLRASARQMVREVAKADLRSEFRRQSSETMGQRTDAATDFDDDKG